jgi:hypothetical protein
VFLEELGLTAIILLKDKDEGGRMKDELEIKKNA